MPRTSRPFDPIRRPPPSLDSGADALGPGSGVGDVGSDPAPETETQLTHSYPATTAAAGLARVATDEWLVERGAGDDLRDRIALAVSELVSNAAEASGDAIVVEAVDRPDRVEITVTNRAADTALPARESWRPEHALADRGRGLFIVDTVADHVEVDTGDDTVRVTAVFDRRSG